MEILRIFYHNNSLFTTQYETIHVPPHDSLNFWNI